MGLEGYRLLKIEEVLSLCAMSKSNLYKMIERGDFPRPVSIGPRSVAWRQSDVASWLKDRPPTSRDDGVAL